MSINKVILSGNLTRDPEQRSTSGGMSVLTFGMAVNDRRKNAQTGAWEDHPNFVDCTVFGNRAEALGRILAKGMKVCVEGKLRWSQWEADGQKRSKIEVIVDEVELMQRQESRQSAPQGYVPAPQYNQPKQAYKQPVYANQAAYAPQAGYQQQPALYDEDIPF